MVEAVIFDLDGTLVDSMWMWESIDAEFLGSRGIEVPGDLQSAIEGMSYTENALYFKNRFDLPESVEELKGIWDEMALETYRRRVPCKPGAKEFLQALQKAKIPCGIATSNSRTLAEAVLESQGLKKYFQSVRTACEVAAGKPAPDIFLQVAYDLVAKPAECLAFEDVPAGIRAGKAAGMRVFAVEDDFSAGLREEKILLADGYIRDYRELLEYQSLQEEQLWELRL